MVFRVLALALMAGIAQAAAHSAELEGVQLEDRVQVDGQALQLNGMAVRTRVFFKVYVAGLYLSQKATTAQSAIDGPGAKRIVLVMLRDASADQFCESVQAGLENNHSDEELEHLKAHAEALYAKIRAIGEAHKGMRIVLDYSDSTRVTLLTVDGAPQGDPIRGREFFRGLLRIWLGERPAQADLKRLLLGQDEDAKE